MFSMFQMSGRSWYPIIDIMLLSSSYRKTISTFWVTIYENGGKIWLRQMSYFYVYFLGVVSHLQITGEYNRPLRMQVWTSCLSSHVDISWFLAGKSPFWRPFSAHAAVSFSFSAACTNGRIPTASPSSHYPVSSRPLRRTPGLVSMCQSKKRRERPKRLKEKKL